MPKYLDKTGLEAYHKHVVSALDKKANEVHVGGDAPTESWIDTWIDTGNTKLNNEVSETSVLSDGEEELTFNEDSSDLSFESDNELAFNEDA